MQQLKLPVWKAIHVGSESTPAQLLNEAAAFAAPSLAGILLDTADAQARGGTGRVFDWSVAASLCRQLGIILAGGLHAENVSAAALSVHPFAVDVSSGVETAGEKDPQKIDAFVKAAIRTE